MRQLLYTATIQTRNNKLMEHAKTFEGRLHDAACLCACPPLGCGRTREEGVVRRATLKYTTFSELNTRAAQRVPVHHCFVSFEKHKQPQGTGVYRRAYIYFCIILLIRCDTPKNITTKNRKKYWVFAFRVFSRQVPATRPCKNQGIQGVYFLRCLPVFPPLLLQTNTRTNTRSEKTCLGTRSTRFPGEINYPLEKGFFPCVSNRACMIRYKQNNGTSSFRELRRMN